MASVACDMDELRIAQLLDTLADEVAPSAIPKIINAVAIIKIVSTGSLKNIFELNNPTTGTPSSAIEVVDAGRPLLTAFIAQ